MLQIEMKKGKLTLETESGSKLELDFEEAKFEVASSDEAVEQWLREKHPIPTEDLIAGPRILRIRL